MKKYIHFALLLLLSPALFSQVQVNKPINLTGGTADRHVTNLAPPTAPDEAANVSSVQSGALSYALETGVANAYVVNLSVAPGSYTAGLVVNFKVDAGHSNTGASTLKVNTLAAIGIKKAINTDLASGDIVAGQVVSVIYDGTFFQMLASTLPKGSNNYIQNQTTADQALAGFRITGNGFFNGGSVGIGSTSAPHKLFVTGGRGFFVTSTNTQPFTIARDYQPVNFEEMRVGVNDSRTIFHYVNDEAAAGIDFRVQNTDLESGGGAAANDNTVMSITGSTLGGKVGIGTTDPLGKLDVYNGGGAGGTGIIDAGENLNIRAFAPNITFSDLSASVDNYAIHLNQSIFTIGKYTSATAVANDLVIKSNNVGIGTSNPLTKLDIRGGYAEDERNYYRDYENVSTTTPVTLLDRNGSALPTNFAGLIFCSVTSTNASGTSYWMVKRWPNGSVSIESLAQFGSVTSNTPEIYNDAGTIKMRLYNHASLYQVRVKIEQLL